MSNFKDIEDVREQRNNTLLKHSAVLEYKIENKLIKTVGNIKSNGAPLTTTATTSSAKILVTSNCLGKSVVSSLSMSLERKNSMQYMSRKIAPHTILADQSSTVVHLDNYSTHFMAQRVTTTKTALNRGEIISEDHSSKIVPCSTKIANISSVGVCILDHNLKVVDGADSSYRSNNKTLTTNKQKMQDSKAATPSKVRGRKNSLALDYKKPKELKINLKRNIPATFVPINSVVKKPKRPGRKRIRKAKQPTKSKIKTKSNDEQVISKEQSDKEKLEMLQNSIFVQSKEDNQLLRPCAYTLQSKKCLNEMTCPYLHSNFPCKYYYLNIPCPQDLKCQFMHNGPLDPKLKEALRNHILDLLSTKPSSVETNFVQQLHYIDDLSHRLQSFQDFKDQNDQIIEVMDDRDEDNVLVIDECRDHVYTNDGKTNTNTLSNITHESIEIQLDMIYENFKEIYYAVDEIDRKLKTLKTSFNISPNEKIHQLQVIYDILKEQEKRLQMYENALSTTQVTNVYDNKTNSALPMPSSNTIIENSNIVLVNPNIIKDKQNSDSQENVKHVCNEENSKALVESQMTNKNLPLVEGTEFLTRDEENFINLIDDENETDNEYLQPTNSNLLKEIDTAHKDQEEKSALNSNIETNIILNVPPEIDVGPINVEKIPTVSEMTIYSKDNDMNNLNSPYNISSDEESLTNNKEMVDNFDLSENYIKIAHKNGDSGTFENFDKNSTPVFNANNSEISDSNKLEVYDKNETIELNNNLTQHNETLEMEIINNKNTVIEHNIKEKTPQEIEEQLPVKPKRKSRIRLRSHKSQGSEEMCTSFSETSTTPERIKPIRTRRLRLPKPIQKTVEKSSINECQINADVINKLIKSPEGNSKTTTLLQGVETPLTQNVVLTKRYLKKAKSKLDHQPQINEIIIDINANVEQNSDINKNSNTIQNIDVSLLTQTSDENNSLHPLIFDGDSERMETINRDIPSSSDSFVNLQKTNFSENKNIEKLNIIQHISFGNPLSSPVLMPSDDNIEKDNLGNPKVLLPKLKTPFWLKTTQNAIAANNKTYHVNSVETSSLLADTKFAQKRRSSFQESDLMPYQNGSKCIKLNNFESERKLKMDVNECKSKSESSIEKDKDFETDWSDEQLTLTSSYNDNQQQGASQSSFSAHQEQYQHTHLPEHEEKTENESDLRQQIENVNNKSDLKLQIQQEQQKKGKITATSFITKNSNYMPQKKHKQEDNITVEVTVEKEIEKDLLLHKQQHDDNELEEGEITNTCNSYDNIEKVENGHTQAHVLKHIYEPEKLTTNSGNKYSKETFVTEQEINVHSSLFDKLTNHSKTRQNNFENCSVNITPISSPTYDNENTIASPSPIRKLIDFRMGGEIDGHLTYPPIPYILHEIDLCKTEVNKPIIIDKLKKTIQQGDPRVFRTHIKKQSVTMFKQIETNFNALVPLQTTMKSTSSMISSYDPRSRSSSTRVDIVTPTLPHQTELTPYNSLQTALVPSASTASTSFMQTGIPPDALPLALQYHNHTSQPIIQTQQQQQTPNMFIYGCLQRSPWYQSLMSTMKIQINQSISQLVRALNNFHRERVFNPEMVFDVFKIDCAGELLEIMRNLGIFVDANGIINEQRHVPSFAGRSCCNTVPVNATYSFIQQYLTPNTQCASMSTESPTTYGAASGANPHEPFVSCYIKAPVPPQKHSDCCCSNTDDNISTNRSCNDRNENKCCSHNNERYDNNNCSGRRYTTNQFKRSYDNNDGNNTSYQQRSNERPSYNNNYNNNPRFMKPGACSPSKSNSSSFNSPKKSFDGGSGGSYGSRGGRGGGGGGRFINNKRGFNSYNKDNGSKIDWGSLGANDNRGSNKYQNNNSPPPSSSPNSCMPSGSRRADEPPKPSTSAAQKSDEEECWD